MDTIEHKKKFDEIVKKYNLFEKDKAEEIDKFLTKEGKVNAKEFATLFLMSENEAKIFLSFIQKGIEFKEEYIDKD